MDNFNAYWERFKIVILKSKPIYDILMLFCLLSLSGRTRKENFLKSGAFPNQMCLVWHIRSQIRCLGTINGVYY